MRNVSDGFVAGVVLHVGIAFFFLVSIVGLVSRWPAVMTALGVV